MISNVNNDLPIYIQINNKVKSICKLIQADGVALFCENDNKLYPTYWICENDLTYKYIDENHYLYKHYKNKENLLINDFNKKDIYISNNFGPISSIAEINICKNGVCIFFKYQNSFKEMDYKEACKSLNFKKEEISFELKDTELIIEVRNVKREYKNSEFITKVLKGVNLSVFKGELVVLLGESGCGKTTLLNVIGGMDQQATGSILFKQQQIIGLSRQKLTRYRRDNIGFIFQTYNLMPNLNVQQNLDLVAELVKDSLYTDDVLKTVGLLEKKKNYPSQLSGGQQQRVSIGRALIKNPSLIIADEPTAALDHDTSIEVLEALNNVVEAGTTLLMVTHNEEIAKIADRVVRMKDGKLMEVSFNLNKSDVKDLVW